MFLLVEPFYSSYSSSPSPLRGKRSAPTMFSSEHTSFALRWFRLRRDEPESADARSERDEDVRGVSWERPSLRMGRVPPFLGCCPPIQQGRYQPDENVEHLRGA
jgi:hypothetical protein